MKTLNNYYLPALFFIILVLIGSCAKSTPDTSLLYTPSSADVTANATLEELQQGRSLYVNNCNECHGLYSPDNLTPVQWKNILISMAPRTSMTPSQILLVTKYLCRGQQ